MASAAGPSVRLALRGSDSDSDLLSHGSSIRSGGPPGPAARWAICRTVITVTYRRLSRRAQLDVYKMSY
eukprot:760267-Hanusia_phi.AAC.2